MLGPNSQTINSFSELLIQFLDLIKYRIGVMSLEMRKLFINSILVTLIDKSIDLRLIRYLVKLIAEWIKYKSGPLLNQVCFIYTINILFYRKSFLGESLCYIKKSSIRPPKLYHLKAGKF